MTCWWSLATSAFRCWTFSLHQLCPSPTGKTETRWEHLKRLRLFSWSRDCGKSTIRGVGGGKHKATQCQYRPYLYTSPDLPRAPNLGPPPHSPPELREAHPRDPMPRILVSHFLGHFSLQPKTCLCRLSWMNDGGNFYPFIGKPILLTKAS